MVHFQLNKGRNQMKIIYIYTVLQFW